MAAYAALVSLMNIMDHIQIHPRFSTSFNKNQIESLGDTVGFLLDFIDSCNYGGVSKQVEDLEGKITRAAHAAEDVIESHIVDLILAESTGKHKHPEGDTECAAHAAEDAMVSHAADQILAGSSTKKGGLLQKMMRCIREKPMKLHLPGVIYDLQKKPEDMDSIKENVRKVEKPMKLHLPSVICDLQNVKKDMDSIKVDVRKVEKQGRFKYQRPHAAASSSRPVRKTPSMVGFDDYLIHLLDKLTGLPSHQQVIPIIGMGGIGKTTLARNAFENLLIKQHFDVCAWATISQNYSVREILLQLLSSQEGSGSLAALGEHQLGVNLHKCLFNRRYLIILDDIWSIDVWDEIKFFFPDNNNGSRIVLTSRLRDISLHFNSRCFAINLLDEDKSWNLFCQESFGDEGCCPAELEELGKKICENCKGLPLSIVVIGGFLRKSCKSRVYWEGIARDTFSTLSSKGENRCMSILSLSYNHLPAHLKPCFLYMGVFAEDDEILVSQLIKLWVAEGFLRPNVDGQSLEEVAEGYLMDLVNRNLILVNKWGSRGKIKGCNVHDLIRELCLKVAKKEKFLCVMNVGSIPRAINRHHRIVIHESLSNRIVSDYLGSASLVRSLNCRGRWRFNFRLLRVLRLVDEGPVRGFLEADLRCVNLRCLDYQFFKGYLYNLLPFGIPMKISSLWNLQMLRIRGYNEETHAPVELWEMVQLRHIQVDELCLAEPPQNGRVDPVLQNLLTLKRAMNLRLTEEVCMRIPNVKKLHLVYTKLSQICDAGSYYCPQNLGRFDKLESLALGFVYLKWRCMVLNITFPSSLKKLSINGGDLYWEDLGMIGSLPSLEVLKLSYSMIGSEWNPVEGEFGCLKFLQIRGCKRLTKWNADYFHFPVLEKLVLAFMEGLDEMPSGFGEIPTLRIISLLQCSVPCALSAVKILEEQESLGNDDLQVEVGFGIHCEKDGERFREMMEEDGFTSNNLHIKGVCS